MKIVEIEITKIKADINQIWKEIQDYEKYYVINNCGIVKRIGGKELKPSKNRGGYYWVKLSRPKQRKDCRIHRLVAQAFIPNPKNYPCINHKDGNKLNNQINNLEWCTKLQNEHHAMKLGLYPSGEDNYNAKLTWEKVAEIRNKYIPFKYSRVKLAREYGVAEGSIQRILNGKGWRLENRKKNI